MKAELTPSLWRDGWYRFAKHTHSPNFGPRPANTSIDLMVVHSISLPPGQYGGPEIEALFTNTLDWDAHPYFEQIRGAEVSAHFVIRRDGALIQFVSCDDRAWHAGRSSYQGRDNCNDFSVGIEIEGLEGQLFEDAQYETLSSLCAAIAQHYQVHHIAGHEHVSPVRKQDPGAGFDWLFLQHSLGWPDQSFPLKN
ncbi:1,6-anhydro-N-acetylmuramyl-L-alanine amidase AmpD [Limnohabitans sp.]|uniref:1,6-anhydro-N-acetylmuramyl-L-alanine amidase AmpD n=1 Tax=Limnohabitans sp. TaxID=1907725 RepID=UPI00286EDB9C|nr:1,6-anhydro-N-acetylmuramyl-L-alanine amidase AmpD [Limnohabitans sp.]